MKRFIWLLTTALCAHAAPSQVTIEQGAAVCLGKSTQMICSNVSLAVEGALTCDTSSIVGFGGKDAPRLSAAHPLTLHTLRIDGDATVAAGSITVAGDMVMGGRGTARLLPAASIRLHGSILNENEEGYVTGGRIEKMLPPLPSSERVATGMGLNFTAAQGCDSLLLTRTHGGWYDRGELSIAKVYEFSQPVLLASVDVAYLQAESPKVADSYLIYYRTPQGLGIESVPSETNTATRRVSSKSSEPFEADRLTVFPFPDLGFSKALTPNGDGVNDCFEVRGIEKFPGARLVLLLPSGSIIYDASPYGNDFRGDGLSAGTYYYMFFAESGDAKPAKKGFFELVKEE